jgi:hypothetical protein
VVCLNTLFSLKKDAEWCTFVFCEVSSKTPANENNWGQKPAKLTHHVG